MSIRMVREEDTERLLEIYGQYMDTAITFEYKLPDREEFRQRIRLISREYPYLVWEEKGKILGYAYAHRHMERAAYQWNAELSVYLDRSCRGKGIGTKLYQTLMDILRLQGVKNVYGCVTFPNRPSEHMHEKLGFRLAGRFENAGYKCGAWHAVSWFEKQIDVHENEPELFRPISDFIGKTLLL
ncbi:MAG: GNAT family N-acetyltransferase [Lachnospiraceae bacterium]|nr:GNAT family N-acetyltransferase [Lachnospiraceae bacterium]